VRRTAAFDLLALDKHEPFRSAPGMTEQQMLETDEIFRSRVEALGAVDDLVVTLVAALEDRQVREVGRVASRACVRASGRTDAARGGQDTVFVFTSDHGFHLGQFRLGFDKRQPYDTDILVPLLMSGAPCLGLQPS
jgi:N-acetylglucosamine-6-sulfatase